MEINFLQIILIFLVALIAGIGSVLDEFQTHRPLVACTLTGLILGDLKTGIIIGGTLEMLALGWMNIGAAMAPDAALASVISTIIVIAGKQDINSGIALAVPLAAAGQVLTIFARTITIFFQHQADKYADTGNFKAIEACHILALFVQGLRVAIPSLIVAMFVGTDAVQNMLAAIPEVVTRGLQVGGGIIVVVGYAMVINMMEAKHLMPFFFLGFTFAALSQLNLVALGIVGVVSALIYLELNPKFNKTAIVQANTAATAQADDELDDELD
ncbi:PTS mannose/fructose/sorbose transporter subunit IIC [Clostridium isatidis]|uniref:PTS mannose/fructose/sorbose transporter subunit IIC n=1 Tax=Clostridium isatidis TaxID=182773 RepID=A0A343JCJ8_9CLOT|nr:PTS mannose/fructose/sorbose transporter subunit IIC [Clostridium isatidis]ASW43256.1 PTS mannose/fructose/sorbose transporter subunit IIC [Clostridium isatidis]